MIEQLKNNKTGNFFLLAGPCVIEGEEMAMRIAEKIVNITDKLGKKSISALTIYAVMHGYVDINKI